MCIRDRDMGARLLPKGSDWWRRCRLDAPLEFSDWFRELSLREFRVSWRCMVADRFLLVFYCVLGAAQALQLCLLDLASSFGFEVCRGWRAHGSETFKSRR